MNGIMINSTQFSYFSFGAYIDTGVLKYIFFMIVMMLYICIVCANILLIVVICMNTTLHEPMYIFLCSLFVNELYGSIGLFPFLLIQILSNIHTASTSFCFLQIFCLYSYASIEFFNLAIMSYDRYLAICWPLQYNSFMTSNKIAILIALSWLYSSVMCVFPILLSVSLKLCGNVIDKVYCNNFSIVKLSCYDTTVNNIYGLIGTSLVIVCPVSIIIFTYIKILKVCFSGSKQARQKAVSTCTPHLATILNFSFACFFEIVESRFNMNNVPNVFRIFLSLYCLMCQPLFSPFIYGLKLSNLRIICKNLIFA